VREEGKVVLNVATDLYWIETPTPGRLAVGPRPRGGDWLEDDVRAWKRAGVDAVVSLLIPDEVAEFDLVDEVELSQTNGMLFWSSPITDRGTPRSREEIAERISTIGKLLTAGKNVAIHCRQGIGRSALVAIAVLVVLGLDVDDATARVSKARGRQVPETIEQARWLADFARSLKTGSH
jgi:protein-tyrosine phosphatase